MRRSSVGFGRISFSLVRWSISSWCLELDIKKIQIVRREFYLLSGRIIFRLWWISRNPFCGGGNRTFPKTEKGEPKKREKSDDDFTPSGDFFSSKIGLVQRPCHLASGHPFVGNALFFKKPESVPVLVGSTN